ncbi:MAG: hypothetical protein ACT4PU_04925 [Planctomycetota bacterium]
MSTYDALSMPPRWRPWTLLGLGLATVGLFASMGLLMPATTTAGEDDLRATILNDLDRLEHAVSEFTVDTGAFPAPVFDLGEGYDGGLSDRSFVPFEAAQRWRGPYLRRSLQSPTRSSYWGLAEPRRLLDEDGDSEADELWARLHRGHGEIDDATASWIDQVLDDGNLTSGRMRATDGFLWFKLLER